MVQQLGPGSGRVMSEGELNVCIYMVKASLLYFESNNASHGNDKRGYREATETPREATEAPRRPRRSPLSPTKATEIIAKTALQIPAF